MRMIPLCIERGRPTAAHAVGQRGWEVRLLRTLTRRVLLAACIWGGGYSLARGRWARPGYGHMACFQPAANLHAALVGARVPPITMCQEVEAAALLARTPPGQAFLWASPRAVRTSDIKRTGEVAVFKVDLPWTRGVC